MKTRVCVGLLVAISLVSALIFLLAGDSHFPVTQWPKEAYLGLVFSVVWGGGVMASVAYVFSAMVFVTVAVVGYAIGYKIGSCLPTSSDTK
ncbi:hypothetical protein QTO05_11520 [Vibrio fortis]|uniref:hypothetical protein n=1 Tax=Vibrio fortis TaxID=212667 RepID=UPI002F423974